MLHRGYCFKNLPKLKKKKEKKKNIVFVPPTEDPITYAADQHVFPS
jgi:hypothetical protein